MGRCTGPHTVNVIERGNSREAVAYGRIRVGHVHKAGSSVGLDVLLIEGRATMNLDRLITNRFIYSFT